MYIYLTTVELLPARQASPTQSVSVCGVFPVNLLSFRPKTFTSQQS